MTPLPVRVYYEDADAGGVVYYANYRKYLERARTELSVEQSWRGVPSFRGWLSAMIVIRTLGVDQGQLFAETGLACAVRSLSAEYLRPARRNDELFVDTAIEAPGRAQVIFAQSIRRGDETLLTARVRVACLELARGRPAAIPAPLRTQRSWPTATRERMERHAMIVPR